MDIKHELGGDMKIVLTPDDLDRLKRYGSCQNTFEAEGIILSTTLLRDEFVSEPIAETNGHEVNVYLPIGGIILPTEIAVHKINSAANFYFGELGKINLVGQVEVSQSTK